jgi:hypothetical protein
MFGIGSPDPCGFQFSIQLAVKKRAPLGGGRMHSKQVEPEPGNRRFDPDLARIEPVLQLAAVEHQLKRADPEAEDASPRGTTDRPE